MSVKKTVIGMGFTIAMFTGGAFGQTPQVFLSIVDTVLYPGDQNGKLLTIRMNNPIVHVGGFSVSFNIANPSIINFPYSDVDTTLPYLDTIRDCTPPPCRDTIITVCPDTCFSYTTPITTQGTRSAGFDYVQGRRLSETVLQVIGIAQTGSGPVLQPGNGVLFRVPLTIFPIADSVPLSQRQVKIFFDSIYSNVSDSTGNTIWRTQDGTISLTNGTVTIPYSMKGDCNFDGIFSPTDAVMELGWIFLGTPMPLPSPAVADVNCDGQWTPSDVVYELSRIFLGIALPCS